LKAMEDEYEQIIHKVMTKLITRKDVEEMLANINIEQFLN